MGRWKRALARLSLGDRQAGVSLLEMVVAVGLVGSTGVVSMQQGLQTSMNTTQNVERLATLNFLRSHALAVMSRNIEFLEANLAGNPELKHCVEGKSQCKFNENRPFYSKVVGGNQPLAGTKQKPVFYTSKGELCDKSNKKSCVYRALSYFTAVRVCNQSDAEEKEKCEEVTKPHFIRTVVDIADMRYIDEKTDEYVVQAQVMNLVNFDRQRGYQVERNVCPTQLGVQGLVQGFNFGALQCFYPPNPLDENDLLDLTDNVTIQEDALDDVELATLNNLVGQAHIISLDENVVKVVNRIGQKYNMERKQLTGWAVRGGGCFAEGTPVKMADGTYRPIETLRPGDAVMDGRTGKPVTIAYGVRGPEKETMYRFHVGDAIVEVTRGHPMLTMRGVLQADDVVPTDKLLMEDGGFHAIRSITPFQPSEQALVYNLYLSHEINADPTAATIVTRGLVTGDLRLQKHLEQPFPRIASSSSVPNYASH